MITNGKYASVKRIIEKAYRDLGFQEDINFSSAVEWAGEAMELIGSPVSFKNKVQRIDISNYKGALPCDLHYIEATRGAANIDLEDCEKLELSQLTPMRYSTDAFHHYYCQGNSDCDIHSELTYNVNDNYMFTSFKEGVVLIAYQAVPVDDEGFPLIPDDIKFVEAVAAHLKMKIAFIKWSTGKLRGDVYSKLEQDRDWYIGAAQTRGVMPNPDMMESIKNNWIRLIPKINQHSDSYKSAGTREQRYTHNSTNSTNRNRDNSDTDTFFHYVDSDN